MRISIIESDFVSGVYNHSKRYIAVALLLSFVLVAILNYINNIILTASWFISLMFALQCPLLTTIVNGIIQQKMKLFWLTFFWCVWMGHKSIDTWLWNVYFTCLNIFVSLCIKAPNMQSFGYLALFFLFNILWSFSPFVSCLQCLWVAFVDYITE